ncbi:MAG: hypothetical protein JXA94_07105, partial [Parachlamydiales bacterium]|nr:hypothetical protein [Parachlamydiales bacterium]
MNNAKKILIITSSAGSGHLQAAKAIEQHILSNNPNAKIVQKDLFLSFGFKKISKFFFHFFNKIPKNGLVPLHEKMVNLVFLSDKLLWPKFLFQIFFFLLKNDFDKIVDTQRVGTSALIKAIRLYNKFKKKSLYLEKVIVDLPTKRATNYFKYIKSLSKNDKKSIILYSLEPLLDDETTDEMFWKKHCKISKDQVIYKKYFIRNAFKNFQNKKIDENPIFIKIKTSNELERDHLTKIINVQNIDCLYEENVFTFSIKKQYVLMTILLGSLPSIAATKNYFTNFVLHVKNKKIEKTI